MRVFFSAIVSITLFGLSACTVPKIDINPTCEILENAFISEPNQITNFAKNSGITGYVNRDLPEQDFELHIISSYESSGTVNVGKTDKPVVLALIGYEVGLWQINQSIDSKIAKIITLGYNPQRVTSSLESDRVLSCPKRTLAHLGNSSELNGNTRYMPEKFLSGLEFIQSLTGLAESSYQYYYNPAGPFEIPVDLTQIKTKKDVINASRPSLLRDISDVDTLKKYKAQRSDFPFESQATIDILLQAMEVGSLPILHIEKKRGGPRNQPYDLQPIFPERKIATVQGSGPISCDKTGTSKVTGGINRDSLVFLIGGKGKDKTKCAFGKNVHIGGGNIDHLTDSWGDDIFNPGTENDIIEAGWGRDIIVLEKGWGDDVLHKTCHDGFVDEKNKKRLLWPTQYYNFVVFGPGIDSEMLRRESKNVIIYPPTQDRLTMASTCFSFTFADSREAIDKYTDIPLLDENNDD